MDHVGLDLTGAQPTRQPEAIAAGFIGDGDPLDRAPSPNGFIPNVMLGVVERRGNRVIRAEPPRWGEVDLNPYWTVETNPASPSPR